MDPAIREELNAFVAKPQGRRRRADGFLTLRWRMLPLRHARRRLAAAHRIARRDRQAARSATVSPCAMRRRVEGAPARDSRPPVCSRAAHDSQVDGDRRQRVPRELRRPGAAVPGPTSSRNCAPASMTLDNLVKVTIFLSDRRIHRRLSARSRDEALGGRRDRADHRSSRASSTRNGCWRSRLSPPPESLSQGLEFEFSQQRTQLHEIPRQSRCHRRRRRRLLGALPPGPRRLDRHHADRALGADLRLVLACRRRLPHAERRPQRRQAAGLHGRSSTRRSRRSPASPAGCI